MTVRNARRGDAAGLAAVHIETWQHAYRHIFPKEFLLGLDWEARRRWFETRIEADGGDLLVADGGAGPVGFCFFGHAGESGWGELYAIYVHPEQWGQGHGSDLLKAAEVALGESGFERALLWVLEQNGQARAFYESRGWRLGRPIRIEEIGSTQVTEVRYERDLRASAR